MSTAQNLLVGYGVIVLAYGFLVGVPLAAARTSAVLIVPGISIIAIATLVKL